ncbi:aminotransferase class V-fold PLP-dependent enzyme [Candidatus Woesearchaeota archaeon]|nr:aminotransferase class V-fold PLP-dependent enzyme [Candidatus Woesearchaeota archaeon]
MLILEIFRKPRQGYRVVSSRKKHGAFISQMITLPFFTPGPSQLYPGVAGWMQEAISHGICSLSHRSAAFEEIMKGTIASLRELMGIPPAYLVFFLSSGTEAMERVIQNGVKDVSFHVTQGAFSERFFAMARELGKHPLRKEFAQGMPVDLSAMEVQSSAELICLTQNETSTGVQIPVDALLQFRKKNPDILLAIDAVSSAPCIPLPIEAMDCIFFSVQKCFGLPAGLCVLIVSPRAMKKAEAIGKEQSIGSYHAFPSLATYAAKNQTPETPNVLAIFLLGKVCRAMLTTGIGAIRQETEKKAELLYSFFDAHPSMTPFVEEPSARSRTVIVIRVPDGSASVISSLKTQGLIVGAGYKEHKDTCLRIANFPAHTVIQMERLLASLK